MKSLRTPSLPSGLRTSSMSRSSLPPSPGASSEESSAQRCSARRSDNCRSSIQETIQEKDAGEGQPAIKPPSSSFISKARQNVGEAYTTQKNKAQYRTDAVKDGVEEKKFDAIEKVIDAVAQKEIRKSLTADPWMPKVVVSKFDELWATLYPQIMKEVKEVYMSTVGSEGKAHKKLIKSELDLENWPPPPPPHRVLRWICSKVLYSINPADKTIFYTLQSHHIIFVFLALFPYGVSTVYWFIFMLCMDKTDEYQLVSYIAVTRTIWFLTYGVGPLLTGFFSFSICSIQSSCESSAPGVSDLDLIASMALLFNVVSCYYIHLKYRRQVRTRYAQYLKDKADLEKGRVGKVEKFRSSPYFRALLWYDLALAITFIVATVAALVYAVPQAGADSGSFAAIFVEGGRRIADLFTLQLAWRGRIVIRLATVSVALLYAPFIVLTLPGIDYLLLKLRTTGYDQAGRLHLQLSLKDMKAKWIKETTERKSLKKKAAQRVGNVKSRIADKVSRRSTMV